MRCPAKLIGGRFDGDQGTMRVAEVPEFIYAFACPNAGCRNGGVHWAMSPDKAPADTELYAHTGFDGEHDEMPVAVYVAAPGNVDLDSDRERDLLHA